MKVAWTLSTLIALGMASTAGAGQVKPAGVQASSEYVGEGNYAPKRVMDGKVSTSWVEGDEGSGLGSWIELDLGGEKEVKRLRVWAGDWYSSTGWGRANRPKELEFKFSDGSSESMSLTDEMVAQELSLASPKKTTSIKVKVKRVYSGSAWPDTAISEIQVFDTGGDSHTSVSSFEASSVLAPDADGSYDAHMVSDGISDTMWCEGSKEGDGTGEWLHFDFGGSQAVSSLELVNGIGTTLSYWMKGNRVTSATLTFSDGATETVAIKNSMMRQTVTFPSHQTSSVRVTFTEVSKGKEYNDLCISEARFK